MWHASLLRLFLRRRTRDSMGGCILSGSGRWFRAFRLWCRSSPRRRQRRGCPSALATPRPDQKGEETLLRQNISWSVPHDLDRERWLSASGPRRLEQTTGGASARPTTSGWWKRRRDRSRQRRRERSASRREAGGCARLRCPCLGCRNGIFGSQRFRGGLQRTVTPGWPDLPSAGDRERVLAEPSRSRNMLFREDRRG